MSPLVSHNERGRILRILLYLLAADTVRERALEVATRVCIPLNGLPSILAPPRISITTQFTSGEVHL